MNTIYKYPLEGIDHAAKVEVEMPQVSLILAVQVQDEGEVYVGSGGIRAYGTAKETVCLWALVDTDEGRMVRRMFRIYGTGRKIREPRRNLNYIGTVQIGSFVWHIFERKPK